MCQDGPGMCSPKPGCSRPAARMVDKQSNYITISHLDRRWNSQLSAGKLWAISTAVSSRNSESMLRSVGDDAKVLLWWCWVRSGCSCVDTLSTACKQQVARHDMWSRRDRLRIPSCTTSCTPTPGLDTPMTAHPHSIAVMHCYLRQHQPCCMPCGGGAAADGGAPTLPPEVGTVSEMHSP